MMTEAYGVCNHVFISFGHSINIMLIIGMEVGINPDATIVMVGV
jgi:hypothetical protein